MVDSAIPDSLTYELKLPVIIMMSAGFDISAVRKYVLEDVLASALSNSSNSRRRLQTSNELDFLNIGSMSIQSEVVSPTSFNWTASFVVSVTTLADIGFTTKEVWADSVVSVLTGDVFTSSAVVALGDPYFLVTGIDVSSFTASPTPIPTPSPTPIPSASTFMFPIASEAVVAVVGAAVAASVAAR